MVPPPKMWEAASKSWQHNLSFGEMPGSWKMPPAIGVGEHQNWETPRQGRRQAKTRKGLGVVEFFLEGRGDACRIKNVNGTYCEWCGYFQHAGGEIDEHCSHPGVRVYHEGTILLLTSHFLSKASTCRRDNSKTKTARHPQYFIQVNDGKNFQG